jgi:ubiquinone biosynthesis protein
MLTRGSLRLLQIARVVLRWRLDALLEGTVLERRLALLKPFVPAARAEVAELPRGARLRLALQELGPIFVKFGQILSTRRDIVPHDIAEELTLLQDRVAPFDGETARRMVERALGQPIAALYAEFDETPLASASIAQVHAARLHGEPGREVVVKVLRPAIEKQIAGDIALLRTLASLVERTHPAADKIRPNEVVSEIEVTLRGELDLQREGANASLLRRHWLGSEDLYVPEVFWSHTSERVLTLERVFGIPSNDIAALDAAGVDRKVLSAKGVRVFYTQVFRDNFFHADAHAGNIWVDPSTPANPRFIALDFGIMGQLSAQDQYYLAENFMAIFQRDYRRIAELHVEAGWMPRHIRIDELEAAARAVCEPYFTRPLSDISLAEVLVKLFRTAQRYELTLQPQLILLQKTLLNIEGVGRLLDPRLDIWAVARPVLETILRERYSPAQLAREFRKRLPELITRAPDMPRLLHDWLAQQVEGKHTLHMESREIAQLTRIAREAQRQVVYAILGSALMIVGAVLYGLEAGGPVVMRLPAAVWISLAGAFAAFLAAWPRRR